MYLTTGTSSCLVSPFSSAGTMQGKPPSALCHDRWSLSLGMFALENQPRSQGASPWLWRRGGKAREKRPGDEVAGKFAKKWSKHGKKSAQMVLELLKKVLEISK